MRTSIKKYTWFIFIILLISHLGFTQGIDIQNEANNKFITLFLHGFYVDKKRNTGESMLDSINLFKYPYSTINYFRGDSGPYSDPDIQEYTNIMGYTFTDGYGRGLPEFPDRPIITEGTKTVLAYTPNPEKNYTLISDIFMEELGDFNSGSRYLIEKKQQCFISLSKCEWVYRNSIELKENKPATKNINDIIETLIISGPDFIDLLTSADYILGLGGTGSPNKLFTLVNDCNYSEGVLRDIAEEFVALAKTCPNSFHLTAHSMGGMYAMRYLSEPESKYYSNEPGGFYQRNQEYTFTEYLEDVYDITIFPTTFLPEPLPYYNNIILYMRSVFKTQYPGLSDLNIEKLIYNRLFKEERQNSVDKLVTLDSPLNGGGFTQRTSGSPGHREPEQARDTEKEKVHMGEIYTPFTVVEV